MVLFWCGGGCKGVGGGMGVVGDRWCVMHVKVG